MVGMVGFIAVFLYNFYKCDYSEVPWHDHEGRGRGRVTDFWILGQPGISGADKVKNFKFSVHIEGRGP